jgi:UDP-N-acetylglucosamine:LPS N-acetylglucosamine transferase
VLGEKADAAELATAVAAIGNDPEKLRRMGEAASAIGNRDAAALIAARILQVAGEAAETKTEGETSA